MRLIPIRKEEEKSKDVLLTCPKCKYKKPLTKKVTIQRIIEHNAQEDITVIGRKEAKIRTMPTVKVECQKCSSKEAYWWIVQTRGADESPTQFFRCTRCKHTWREMA
jgi:DNA-directed RNA polymerase subunit M